MKRFAISAVKWNKQNSHLVDEVVYQRIILHIGPNHTSSTELGEAQYANLSTIINMIENNNLFIVAKFFKGNFYELDCHTIRVAKRENVDLIESFNTEGERTLELEFLPIFS